MLLLPSAYLPSKTVPQYFLSGVFAYTKTSQKIRDYCGVYFDGDVHQHAKRGGGVGGGSNSVRVLWRIVAGLAPARGGACRQPLHRGLFPWYRDRGKFLPQSLQTNSAGEWPCANNAVVCNIDHSMGAARGAAPLSVC